MNTVQFFQTTPEQLVDLITQGVKIQLQEFKRNLNSEQANDDLLTREETCKFLSIDSSTLWAWTNKGKVKAYGIGSRRYYKRAELLESLIPLKK
ncbi:helix-turn-helix domain-containing protein [Gelidibacter salicanalis]|uniref:Helix-turn-helix domain-containing protein n=1 Tax=Gelidibacter salicanalis TaxID=291193 RepID=A0A5C7AP07_9FLAO|nr:helix-turn-helix domain-containing protein [Gelidibacter salicanalis]TXE10500.1 helix-turn-helix domain-containing protein [Gelidibacter salicanalis]